MADIPRAARALREFLEAVGAPLDLDPELLETPERVARTYAEELLSGYAADPCAILADTTHASADGLVLLADIATTTTCPHHLMPSVGRVHVGYLPGTRVVGFGALGRLVDCYARRLMLQEELGRLVASALIEWLGARGAGCVVDMQPTCVTARGGRRHGARAVTQAWAGEMERSAERRAEMLLALGGAG